MWQDADLEQHMQESPVISSKALVVAEWNMNDANNFASIGNYRGYRGSGTYAGVMKTWDKRDAGGWWKNATESDVEVFGPYDETTDEPLVFLSRKENMKRLYSLDDCLLPNRPRSGINYFLMPGTGGSKYVGGLGKRVSNQANNSTVKRPRYYMSDYNAVFKYWTSYRKESGVERGISSVEESAWGYNIDDCMPFVVYKDRVPANKIVVKMQTNIGTVDIGQIQTPGGKIDDPLYGQANSTTPTTWEIQVLKSGQWVTAQSFDQASVRSDGSAVVGPDGYVEIAYGVKIPTQYNGPYRFMGTVANESLLPIEAYPGDYFFVVPDEDVKGSVYLWYEGDWVIIANPDFGWQLVDGQNTEFRVTDLVSPVRFTNSSDEVFYKEFEYIKGVRVAVRGMNTPDTSFELIEMSPRLAVDMTDKTVSVNITKSTGNIDSSALPVGGLQPGTGIIELFDTDFSLLNTNEQSIVSPFLENNITFSFTDIIEQGNVNYYIPIKKLYTEGKAPSYSDVASVKFDLRDAFYMFEKQAAPQILMKDISLSGALSILLDSIGFSNYVFLNKAGAPEPILPYFFIPPEKNVAEILQELAVATQSAMYFDEYNNLVVAYRDYLLSSDRDVDIVLDAEADGSDSQPNIIDISSTDKKIYNAGKITYTERYIQRSIGSLAQANVINKDQRWIYLPALLWEVSASESTRTVNDKASTQSSYALGAMPLDTTLTSAIPYVDSSRQIQNNVINVGDSVYWLPRFNGFLYANGEIIRFDAVGYYVQGQSQPRVWISNNDEYQEYFSQLPFNGKMYPDGYIRIYTEPKYEKINSQTYIQRGAVAKHGRGQFNTPIVEHAAGLRSYWTSQAAIRGIRMDSSYLFKKDAVPPATTIGPAGWAAEENRFCHDGTTRTGLIKNFMRSIETTDVQQGGKTSSELGAIQASALSVKGRKFPAGSTPRDYVTYIYKQLEDPTGTNSDFKHFGTRMRIIGKLESAADVDQTPSGSTAYYDFTASGESVVLNGGSAGLGVGVNPSTNNGYYVELIALTSTNLEDLSQDNVGGHNIIFYKIARAASGDTTKAIPIKLWGGLTDVIVDNGTFAGMSRTTGEEQPSVYDLSIEWEDKGWFVRFYIFLNGIQVATVDDYAPLPIYNNMALFVRGSAHAMFENVYALRQSLVNSVSGQVAAMPKSKKDLFGRGSNVSSFKRYGISGVVRDSYLSGVGGAGLRYSMYFDEFGTIMRECAYFDIKYDKAYPALTSQISPPLNENPAYVVSGYRAGSYGAKFLVFNVMDKAINLDETSGNYLRIQGVTFTQNTQHELTMDEYYNETSSLSDPDITDSGLVVKPPRAEKNKFKTLKINRMKYGMTEWSFESNYVQSQGAARSLMEWLSEKTTRARKLVGIEIFYNPLVQLGDVVSFLYQEGGVDKIAPEDTKFIVYNIEYSRTSEGPTMTLYVSET